MATIIKLESGQLLNLDTMAYTTIYEDGMTTAVLVNGSYIELSEKDLEKISEV